MLLFRSVVTLLLVSGLTASAADWPQLLGPSRDGVTTEKGLIDTWPKAGPEELWQRAVGVGYAGPVVADGRLVLFHRVGDDDVVECLSADKGKPVWKFTYATSYEDGFGKGNGPRATPVISGGRVYALGAGGQLHCLDFKTGKRVWAKELLKDYTVPQSFFGVGTTPIVEGKLLVVNVGGQGAGIVAFDAETGKEKWKATTHEASYSSPVAATVGGERLLFFFTREGLVALSPADGKVRFSKRWRARIHASVNAAMPVVLGGDHVLVTSSYATGALLTRFTKGGSGEEVWKGNDVLSSHFSTPVAVGKYLFGFDGRQEEGAVLRCIDWKAGKVRWSENGFGCGSIIAAPGDRLFILSEGGELVLAAASGEKYQEKARSKLLTGPVRAHPALADGRLFARDDRKLVCWKVKK